MARPDTYWFEFNGVRSTDKNLKLLEIKELYRAAERGIPLLAAGRSGDVWDSEDAYDVFELKTVCRMLAGASRDAINAWLRGEGWLRLSDYPDRRFYSRISTAVRYTGRFPGAQKSWGVETTFTCQPFGYLYPEVAPIEVTSNNAPLLNAGTFASDPRIIIEGNGTFSLSIGLDTVWFEGVEGGIIIDREMMDAFDLSGSVLANDKMRGEPLAIPEGTSILSWALDDGASVSKVTIIPRWRFI